MRLRIEGGHFPRPNAWLLPTMRLERRAGVREIESCESGEPSEEGEIHAVLSAARQENSNLQMREFGGWPDQAPSLRSLDG